MNLTRNVAVAFLILVGGCSETEPTAPGGPVPPELTSDPGSLLVERETICVPHDAPGDTLFIHNLGSRPLEWVPLEAPAGTTNLMTAVTVDSGTVAAVVWTWTVTGSLPARDSLRVATSDPLRPRLTLPMERKNAGFIPTSPPGTPRWLTPSGRVFRVGVEQLLEWTRVTDCAGIKHFVIQVSSDPAFPSDRRVAFRSASPRVSVIAEAGDVGPGYARVAAVATDNRTSSWSATLSWTVLN